MKKKFDLKIVILMLGIIILSLGITALVVINSISSTNVIPSDAVLNGENISDVIRNAYIISTDNNTIKYYYNGKIYEYKGKLDKQCSKIVDLIFDGKKIVGIISKENYIIGKVEYNEKDMLTYVDGKAYSIDDNLAVYQVNKDTVKQQLPEIINSKKCSVYLSNGKICALVENQDSSDSSNTNVRVIIRNNDSIYFDNLWIYGENLRVNDKETKKKSTRKRKSSKKKTEEVVKETDTDVESITDVDEATEYLEDIINFTSEEWEDEEKTLRDKLTSLEIRPDLNPDDVKKLIAKLSETYTDIKGRLVDVERSANSLEKQIKDIKTLNSIGSNATERNLAATKAVMFFKKNPDDEKAVDLEQYLLMLKHKVNFYKYCIDTMGYNRQLLITFASVFKIEINNM